MSDGATPMRRDTLRAAIRQRLIDSDRGHKLWGIEADRITDAVMDLLPALTPAEVEEVRLIRERHGAAERQRRAGWMEKVDHHAQHADKARLLVLVERLAGCAS